MNKEIEFLEKQGHTFDKDKDLLFMEEFFSSEYKVKDICNLLKEYADQQTSELKAELAKEKRETIGIVKRHVEYSKNLKAELDKTKTDLDIFQLEINALRKAHATELKESCDKINKLKSELNELKERHNQLTMMLNVRNGFR